MWVRSLDESQRVNTVMCGQFRIHVFVSVCDGVPEVLDTARADRNLSFGRTCRAEILHGCAARWQASTIFAT